MTLDGMWTYDADAMGLDFTVDGSARYTIDLERCRTSAEVLDWIIQLSQKPWLSDQGLGQLVRKLDELLAPQETLCSFGQELGPIVPKNILPTRAKDEAPDKDRP